MSIVHAYTLGSGLTRLADDTRTKIARFAVEFGRVLRRRWSGQAPNAFHGQRGQRDRANPKPMIAKLLSLSKSKRTVQNSWLSRDLVFVSWKWWLCAWMAVLRGSGCEMPRIQNGLCAAVGGGLLDAPPSRPVPAADLDVRLLVLGEIVRSSARRDKSE